MTKYKPQLKKITKAIAWFLILTIVANILNVVVAPKVAKASPGTRTKTVEFYVGQHTGTGTVALNTYWSNTFSVYLPDAVTSSTAIKSAYIDFTFCMGTTTAAGIVSQELKENSEGSYDVVTSVSYLSSAEAYVIRHRANFLSKFQNIIQSAGTYTFNYRAKVAGTATRMLNAKLTLTYDYDDTATTQIKTVRYFGGQDTGDLAVGGTSQYTLAAPGLPESSASVYDAWAEVSASIVGTSTTDSRFGLWYDSDSATTVMVDNAGGSGQRPALFLLKKVITDAAHTFNINNVAGYPITLASMEQVITYSFNYSSSTSLLTTHEVLMGSDGTRASSATLDWNKTINIPESSLTWKSIYIKGVAHSVGDNGNQIAAQLHSAPTPSNTYSFNYNGETYHNYYVLSNETNDLNTMTTGDNAVYVRWVMSSGTATSRSASVVLTYIHAKSDAVVNTSAKFFIGQDTSYGTTYTPSFDVSISGTTQNMTSSVYANSVNGSTSDSATYISIQPTSTSTYNWNSSNEYQWIIFAHDNVSDEITGTGTYTANLNSGANNVMSAYLIVNWQYSRAEIISLTTDKGSYPTLGETITVDLTAQNNSPANITGSTLEYVFFIDADADHEPDAGETYITNGCAGSASWSSGNYTHQTTGFAVNGSGGTNADQWSCSNSNFPQNTTYHLWAKWYKGSVEYDTNYVTFTSVPTLGEILFVVLVGVILFFVIRLIWLFRKKRQWLFYYLMAAFSLTLALIFFARRFGIDQFLVNTASFHVQLIAELLFKIPMDILTNGRLQIFFADGGSSILKLGIECSAVIESSILISLMLLLPIFSLRQRLLRASFGLVMTYVINICRLMIIVLITYKFGPDYIFIAHAAAGRFFFFVFEIFLFWFLFTKPIVKSVGDSIARKKPLSVIARSGQALSWRNTYGQAITSLVIVAILATSFSFSNSWQKAFISQKPAEQQVMGEEIIPIKIDRLAPNQTMVQGLQISTNQNLNLRVLEGKEPLEISVYLNGRTFRQTIIKPEGNLPIIEASAFAQSIKVSAGDVIIFRFKNLGNQTSNYSIEISK